jgi:hypothetical protein
MLLIGSLIRDEYRLRVKISGETFLAGYSYGAVVTHLKSLNRGTTDVLEEVMTTLIA